MTASEHLIKILKRAIRFVEIETAEGNPILAMWLPNAKAAIVAMRKEEADMKIDTTELVRLVTARATLHITERGLWKAEQAGRLTFIRIDGYPFIHRKELKRFQRMRRLISSPPSPME